MVTFRVSSDSLGAINSIQTYVYCALNVTALFSKERISESAGLPKRPRTVATEEKRKLLRKQNPVPCGAVPFLQRPIESSLISIVDKMSANDQLQ